MNAERFLVVDITGQAVARFYTEKQARGYILLRGGAAIYHVRLAD